jgi:tetratricopeptide (TPR) repeat protein
MLPNSLNPFWRFRICCIAAMVGVAAPVTTVHADSVVLGEIEYLRSDGRTDDEARGAIQGYLQFFLSRLPYGKPQTVSEYIRDCRLGKRSKESDGSCAVPDFLIQLQISERLGEVQLSGAVNRRSGSNNLRAHNLDAVRVKMPDLTAGLSHVARGIAVVLAQDTTRTEQTHVVIACFGSVASAVSEYAKRLPRALEAQMREQPGITISVDDGVTDCSSVEGLQAIAQNAAAEAVISGRVFTDDRSGLMVLPYIYIVGSTRKVALPVVSVPRGADEASFAADDKVQNVGPIVDTSTGAGIDSVWHLLVAEKLGAAVNALVGSSNRSEFLKAINDGGELAYYLGRARNHLSSSPPDHAAAEVLLELAISKAPGQSEAYLVLAASLMDQRRYKEAAATLRSGLAQVSDRKGLYLALAETSVRAGDLPGARQIYAEALSANAIAEGEALLGTAKTYFSALAPDRSLQSAMEYALRAAAVSRSSEAFSLAGQIAETENNFAEAEEFYKKARALAPESREITSRLGMLYERKATEEARKPNHQEAIEQLTKAIEISPSVRRYYDRAVEYLQFYSASDDRSPGYRLASVDFQFALDIARRDRAILAQFPWLMPNLAETLIFEGNFEQAKNVTQQLFLALASDAAIRPSSNPREIRLIAAFLNAAAEMLDTGVAEKEFYLLENAALGMERARLSWSFADMLAYLNRDYPRIKSGLAPAERDARVAAVKQWIERLENGRSKATP